MTSTTTDHQPALLDQLAEEAENEQLSPEEYVLEIVRHRHDGASVTAADSDEASTSERRIQALEQELTQYASIERDLKAEVADLRTQREQAVERAASLEDDLSETERELERLQVERTELETRLERRDRRVEQLETQLAKRSQIEDKVEELSLVVTEERSASNAPFFVRWWRWLRGE